MRQPTNTSSGLARFFGLSLGLSWLFYFAAIWLNASGAASLARLFHYAGGLAPLLVALASLYQLHSGEEWRDYWRRAVDFMVNFVGELFALSLRAEAVTILLWNLAAVWIALGWWQEGLEDYRRHRSGSYST